MVGIAAGGEKKGDFSGREEAEGGEKGPQVGIR